MLHRLVLAREAQPHATLEAVPMSETLYPAWLAVVAGYALARLLGFIAWAVAMKIDEKYCRRPQGRGHGEI
jgi:hypothetical protein